MSHDGHLVERRLPVEEYDVVVTEVTFDDPSGLHDCVVPVLYVAEIDPRTVVPDNVLGTGVDKGAVLDELLHERLQVRSEVRSEATGGRLLVIVAGNKLLSLRSSLCLTSLNGVTFSGTVRFKATDLGTPTWSIPRLGSAVMTVRAEKFTRLPMRLPRIRPSLPLSLLVIVFNGLPLLVVIWGSPRSSLSMNAATLCWRAMVRSSCTMSGSAMSAARSEATSGRLLVMYIYAIRYFCCRFAPAVLRSSPHLPWRWIP